MIAPLIRNAHSSHRSAPSPWRLAFWTLFLIAGAWIAAQLAWLIICDWRAAGML